MHSAKGVTVLFLGVLTSAGMHLLRMNYAIHNWAWLQNTLGWIVFYMFISGFTFFFLSLIMILLIMKRNKHTSIYLTIYVLLLLFAYWIDRLFLSVGETPRNIPFVIGFQLFILLVYIILIRSRGVQAYFGEKHA